jgi:hypothetical protein
MVQHADLWRPQQVPAILCPRKGRFRIPSVKNLKFQIVERSPILAYQSLGLDKAELAAGTGDECGLGMPL